jgi:hypothetical protein
MNRFQPGEVVDITITGARVVSHDQPDDDPPTITFTVQNSTTPVTIPAPSWNGIEVVPKAPAEWPPQPGDLWHDGADRLWFAFDATDYDADEKPKGVRLCGTSAYGDGAEQVPDNVNKLYGPMTLVRRDDRPQEPEVAW